MIKKLFTILYADENILYFGEDFGNVVFNCNEMGIINIHLNCIDPDTIMSDFWLGMLNLKNTKHLIKT